MEQTTTTDKRRRDPEKTKKRILSAARSEFGKYGFDGARVDRIATSAKVSKNLLYHYYGSKDRLFTTVLEGSYFDIRAREFELDLDSLPADLAVMKLVEASWGFYLKNPDFIWLLTSENRLKARHVRKSPQAAEVNRRHALLMKKLLERGEREGSIRPGIDPVQLNISIAALGFFYLLNRHTLSTAYDRDLSNNQALTERLAVIKETIMCWITPKPPSTDT